MFLYPYPPLNNTSSHFSETSGWIQQDDNRVTISTEMHQNNGRHGKNGLIDLGNPDPPPLPMTVPHSIQIPDTSTSRLTSQHFQQCELQTEQKPLLDDYSDMMASISGYNAKDKCGTCGEELYQTELIQHMRNHMGPRRCEICNYEAPTKHHLREHLNTHTGLKPYKCQFCGKSFAAKNSLRVHTMYLHTKVRAHQCHFCDQRFVTTSERKSHELVHTDKCPVCQMSFRLRGHLRQHMKSHANSAFHHKKR